MTKPVVTKLDNCLFDQANFTTREQIAGYFCDMYDRGTPPCGHFHRTIVTPLKWKLDDD